MNLLIIPLSILFVLGLIIYLVNSPKIKGNIGELFVSSKLSFLPKNEYITLNNLLFFNEQFTTQIDHIVISVYGIFVIETKNYKGVIYGNANSDYWTQNIWGNKYQLYNPILQNQNHIKFLLRKFSMLREIAAHINPIIVFLRASRIDISGNTYCVVWYNQLYQYIKSYQQKILTIEECQKIANILKGSNITDNEKQKRHLLNTQIAIHNHETNIANGICPRCGRKLVLRKGKFGNFWGCSNYPRCRYTHGTTSR